MNPPPAPPRRGASSPAPVAGSPPGRGEGVGSSGRFTSDFWRCSLPMNFPWERRHPCRPKPSQQGCRRSQEMLRFMAPMRSCFRDWRLPMTDWFRITNEGDVPSPALLIYPERVEEKQPFTNRRRKHRVCENTESTSLCSHKLCAQLSAPPLLTEPAEYGTHGGDAGWIHRPSALVVAVVFTALHFRLPTP